MGKNIIEELNSFLQIKMDEKYEEGIKECGYWVLNHLKLSDEQHDKLCKYLYDQNLYDYKD